MDSRIESLARLIVEFGANVQPGQIVDVNADLGKEELARAIAAIAYERGAKFVDVTYYDPYVKHARVSGVREESLDYAPPWRGQHVLELGRVVLDGAAASVMTDGRVKEAYLGG